MIAFLNFSPPPGTPLAVYADDMITLTRLNGSRICVNTFLIEHIEETPDTVITLTNGHHFLVRESVDDIVGAATAYLGGLRKQDIDPVTAGQLGRVAQ